MCRFDRNHFGQFMGSATVTYERPEDASQAISEYHGAYLDDKVLIVEPDMIPTVTKVLKNASPNEGTKRPGRELQVRKNGPGIIRPKPASSGKGKTLRLN